MKAEKTLAALEQVAKAKIEMGDDPPCSSPGMDSTSLRGSHRRDRASGLGWKGARRKTSECSFGASGHASLDPSARNHSR